MVEPRSKVYHLGGATLSATSPMKVMLNHRNNLAMLYRCAPTFQRMVVAVVRPILDMAAALVYLLQGKVAYAKAVFKAYGDFLAWHGRLSKERKAIRAAVRGEAPVYKGSIVLRYLFGKRKFQNIM